MIDYLEQLLEEQEREEPEGGTPDMGAVFLPAGRRTVSGAAGAEADEEPALAATDEEKAAGLTAAPNRQEGYLPAAQARSWAEGLYRTAVDAGRAAVAVRQSGARVLTVTEQAAPGIGLGAAELDEVFARDARRYDGGFALY